MVRPIANNHQEQSMVTTLRGILRLYPGGHTIFRELLQNADDAGAKTVRFFLDDQIHQTSNLIHSHLAQYQGPSLLTYNSAEFSEKDFENLKSTGASYKFEDGATTGRFGLGFNSVYNYTDSPTIVSRDRLLFLDPHERWPAEYGKSPMFDFVADGSDRDVQGQMAAFSALMPDTTQALKGTIIRVPLRTKEQAVGNQISEDVPAIEEVQTALDEFAAEFGNNGLLFMRNVEQLVICSRGGKSVEIRLTNVDAVRSDRAMIKSALQSAANDPTFAFNHSFVIKVEYHNGDELCQTEFGVHHCISGISAEVSARKLPQEVQQWSEKEKLTPWIAVAAQLPCPKYFAGRLFTVLPLPLTTGQPVHIHGLFGITPDRARLYWEDDLKDKPMPARWNEFLFNAAVPRAWTDLLHFISTNLPHRTLDWWPLKTNNQTKLASAKVANLILKENLAIFPTEIGYRAVNEAYLSTGTESEVLRDAFKEAGVPVVYISQQLRPLIQKLFDGRMMSPELLADFLKGKNDHIRGWSAKTKKIILDYLLLEASSPVAELELFPFEDGVYRSISTTPAFLYRDDLDKKLFAVEKSRNLELDCVTMEIKNTMIHICNGGSKVLPIRYRTATDFKNFCMKTVFQDIDAASGSVTLPESAVAFIPDAWKWISKNFRSIGHEEIAGLWLLPLNTGKFRKVNHQFDIMPPMIVRGGEMEGLLKKFGSNPLCGGSVLVCAEKLGLQRAEISRLFGNPAIIESLFLRDSANMLHLTQWLRQNSNLVTAASAEEKQIILKYLASAASNLTGNWKKPGFVGIKEALRSLQIFRRATWDCKENKATAAWTTLDIVKSNHFYIGLADGLIPVPEIENIHFLVAKPQSGSRILLDKFGLASSFSTADIIQDYIIPNFESCQSSVAIKTEVAKLIMRKFSDLADSHDKLRYLQFVPTATILNQPTQTFAKPIDLIDPTANDLKALFFDDEEVLPEDAFFREFGSTLRICGLKTDVDKILAQKRVQCYASRTEDLSEIQRRAHCLLEADCRWAVKSLSGKDKSDFRNLAWLPVIDLDGKLVQKASKDCRGVKDRLIAGSVLPILNLEISSKWEIVLGWDVRLSNDLLLKQLDRGLELRNSNDAILSCKVVDAVLSYIAMKGQTSVLKKDLASRPFVLTSSGRSLLPSKIFSSGCERLLPYFGNVDKVFWNVHQDLLKDLGVRDHPPLAEDLAEVQAMLECKAPLTDPNDITTAIELLTLASTAETANKFADLKVLTAEGGFCLSKDISYPNLERVDGNYTLTHPDISLKLARTLGVEVLSERHMKSLLEIMDAEDNDDEFDQKEQVTTGISDTLDRYPVSSTFREYLANADDARASSISWLLDERHHPCDKLLTPELKNCQGPSLLAHNTSVFSETDLKGFKNVGEGSKRQDSVSIGQFGRGSQTMYHFTDTPMILSGEWLLILDPQQKVLPMNHEKRKRKPGVKLSLKTLRKACPNQLAPFTGLWGYTTDLDCYDGTIFRFPLRTPDTVTQLRTKDQLLDAMKVRQQLSAYFTEARGSLLFLRNIRSVNYTVHGTPGSDWSVSRQNLEEFEETSNSKWILVKANPPGSTAVNIDKWRVTMETTPTNADSKSRIQKRAAKNTECGIAALISSELEQPETSCNDLSQFKPLEPSMYSTLPLPIPSNLPVHLHATFALSGDRRSLHLEGYGDKSSVRRNKTLLEDRLSSLYLLFLEDLGKNAPEHVLRFWPQNMPPEGSCSQGLFSAFWKQVPRSGRCLFPKVTTERDATCTAVQYTSFKEAVFNFYGEQDTKCLEGLLVALGVNLIQSLPSKITTQLETMNGVTSLTQTMLRKLFSTENSKVLLQGAVLADVSVLAGLLKFALATDEHPEELDGCHFLHLADGSLGTLKLQSSTNQPVDYYLASDEEMRVFGFASSILVSHSNWNPIKSVLVGSNCNVQKVHPKYYKHLFAMRKPNSMSADWLTEFWKLQNKRAASEDKLLDDLPVYLARRGQEEEFLTGRDLESRAAVVEPAHEEQRRMCEKFSDLWRFDSAFIPPSLKREEESLLKFTAFVRFVRALRELCGQSGNIDMFIQWYLDGEDLKTLRNLVLTHHLGGFRSTGAWSSITTDLASMSLWPSDHDPLTLLPAENCLTVECKLRDSMLVPWMKDRIRFIRDDKHCSCLKSLGIKELSFVDLLRDFDVLDLPRPMLRTNGNAFQKMLATIYLEWSAPQRRSNCSPLLRRRIAVDNDICPRDAHEIFDHEDEIFVAAFRDNNRGKFIHPDLKKYRKLWIALGMQHNRDSKIGVSNYEKCLQELEKRVAQHLVTPDANLERDTLVILDPLISSSSATQEFTADDWAIVAKCAVFRSQADVSDELQHRQNIMTGVATSKPVMNLNNIISHDYATVCWTQVPFPINHPTKAVLRHFGNGKPSTLTVWHHLLRLKEISAGLGQSEINGFLSDLQDTYKFLRDNFHLSTIPQEAKDQPLWLNLDSFEGTLMTLWNVQSEWRGVRELVLSSSYDSGPIKAVKGGLRRFDELLLRMGCRRLAFPIIEASTLQADQRSASVSQGFREMRRAGELLDIVYQSEGRVVKAHSQLLASISKMCRVKFSGRWGTENTVVYEKFDKNGNVNADFLSFHTLSVMINHAYEDEVDWAEMQLSDTDDEETKDRKLDMLLDLHKGADCWDIPVLGSKVEATILNAAREFIRISNVYDVMDRAEEVRAMKIVEYCDSFIKVNQEVVEEVVEEAVDEVDEVEENVEQGDMAS